MSSPPTETHRSLDAVLAELRRLVAAVKRMEARQDAAAADLAALRLAAGGRAYRDSLLRDLAQALALGSTWAAAQSVELILQGVRLPPAGAEAAATALAGVRLSARQVLRILQAGESAADTDNAALLCQYWPPGEHQPVSTDELNEHA